MINVKELWEEFAKTKDRVILVKIGEIARAEQIRQAKNVTLETSTKKRLVRNR